MGSRLTDGCRLFRRKSPPEMLRLPGLIVLGVGRRNVPISAELQEAELPSRSQQAMSMGIHRISVIAGKPDQCQVGAFRE